VTAKELSRNLKLHEVTICKYAAQGIIPGIRVGRAWRFDKDVIDGWFSTDRNKVQGKSKRKGGRKESETKRLMMKTQT
jgi:excisionase family DNA binding protein